jgi:2-polyprenyl-3-methyl-5-hydroxy-6-metoxy-1,4-benzoquinol methylase
MSIVHKTYSFFHRITTPAAERASSVSPGYWNSLVRREVLKSVRCVRGNILDVGCGDGLFLIDLAKQNPQAKIWAVDINPENIRLAKERVMAAGITSVHFSLQNATALQFGSILFDAVVCTNLFMVMDSISTVRKSLVSISGSCRPGALIFFDFRNALNPLLRLKYKLAPLYDNTIKGRSLNAYYPGDISGALKEAGMTMIWRQCKGLPFLQPLAPVVIVKAQKT